MKKVMITGARGFIGKYVVRLLEKEYEVRPFEGNLFETNIEDYVADIKPDYLINLAWVTGPGYLDSEDNIRFVQAGIRLYDAFFANGGKRAVYIGTEQEYKRQQYPLKETDTIKAESLYAECKAYLGKILVDNSLKTGKGFVWGRLFFVYGAGEKEKRLMPSIIRGLLNNDIVTCSYEKYVRDYIYVKDVASAIVACLFSDYSGFVNIGGGKSTSIEDIANTAQSIIGGTGKVVFKAEEDCGQPMCIQADISLLESLGWTQEYELETGIREEIEMMR